MKFNLRIDDLEVRSCGKYLLSDGNHFTAEIVQWNKKGSCHTVAYWIKDEEGYDLQFVGDRPFLVDGELFMKLAKTGQEILNMRYNLEDMGSDTT